MIVLFLLLVAIVSGLAGIVSLFLGAIGPGLGLLVIAFLTFYLALAIAERAEDARRERLQKIASGTWYPRPRPAYPVWEEDEEGHGLDGGRDPVSAEEAEIEARKERFFDSLAEVKPSSSKQRVR